MNVTEKEFEEILEMMSVSSSLRRQISDKVNFIDSGYTTLLSVKADNMAHAVVELIKLMSKKSSPGIYVNGSITSDILSQRLAKLKIPTSNIFFVDFATRLGKRLEENNFFFSGGPEEMTSLAIALDKALRKVEGKKNAFLIFDSLSSLLAYHSEQTVEKFVHFLATEIRERKLNAVMVAIGDSDKSFLTRIAPSFDSIVYLD